jgi:hypothetical protein
MRNVSNEEKPYVEQIVDLEQETKASGSHPVVVGESTSGGN